MSHYTYTDRLGWDLHVASGAEEMLIQARDSEGNAIGITPRNEDAPAVALAILEAAGVEYVTMAEACNPAIYISPERLAVTRLQEWKRLRDKRAEREAEDAKVREWRKADQEARGVNPDAFPWENLPPNERASWASRYRAARKFFEEGQ